MKITKDWLKEKSACASGVVWFKAQKETDGVKIIKKLMLEEHFGWANWLIVRIMERKKYIAYGVYAARLALPFWVKKYPLVKTVEVAIIAAENCLKNDTAFNRRAADSAASAAYSAAWAAYNAAYNAANAAYCAAYCAAYSAAWAADSAAYNAANAAYYAAYCAADSAANARQKMQIKILNYGLKLLEQ